MQSEEISKYQDRIQQAPDDLAAYEALERIYTRTQDWHALVDLYRKKGPHLSEVGEKRLLWQKIARVAEEVLDEPDLAIRSARDVLPPDGLDRSTLKAIEGLCRRHERWEDLRDFLEVAAENSTDPEEVTASRFRLGELYRNELGDVGEAISCFRILLEEDPHNATALAATEEIFTINGSPESAALLEATYRAAAEWEKLFSLFDRLLTREKALTARADLLRRRAALVEERRGPQAAFPEFAKAFLEGGRQEPVRLELERIADKAGLWRDLLAVYLKSLDQTHGDSASNSILQRAAQIAEDNLGLKAVAEKCYRQLLAFAPSHLEALAALERIYTESGDDAALLGILEKQAEGTDDQADLLVLLHRAGELAEQRLSRYEVAIEKYEAILAIEADDEGAKEALLRLYPRAKRWQALVDHLLREASPAELLDVRRRVAEIYEEKLHNFDAAIEHQEAIREASPGDPKALEALSRLYREVARHSDLLSVLEERVSGESDPDRRFELRLEVAAVHQSGLGEAEKAAELYGELLTEARGKSAEEKARHHLEEMLGVPETRPLAARLLEEFYFDTEAWQRLVDFYERVLGYLPAGVPRAHVLEAVALAYEDRLESPERAFWAHGRAIKEHPAGRRSEAELLRLAEELTFYPELVGLLEDAFEAITGEKPEAPSAQDSKAPPAEEAAPWEEEAAEPGEAAPVEATVSAEAVSDPDGTESVAGDEEPTGVVDVTQVMDVAEAEEIPVDEDSVVEPINEFEVIETVEMVDLDAGPPVELALPLLEGRPEEVEELTDETALRFALQLARLNEEVLERQDTAAIWYRRVREIDSVHRDALVALDRLATERGDDDELRDILSARVEHAKGVSEEVSLRLRLGKLLADGFGDLDGAIREYRAGLRADPGSPLAFEYLESALQGAERWEELADLYDAALERAPRREVALKLAHLRREALLDAEGAIGVLQPLLDEDPGDADVLRAYEKAALEAGFDRDERAARLLPVLEALRDLAPDPKVWRERERRIGEILETALGQAKEAVERYAKVLQEDGEDTVARAALERLARESGTRPSASKVLEPYYRERQEWDPLTDLLRLRLQDARKPKARAALYAEIARIAEEYRDDRETAFGSYASGLTETPSDMSLLESVDRLASELGHFEELCALLDETGAALEAGQADAQERVHVLRRLAEVSLLSLEDRERALAAYSRALELRPDDAEIFRALEELYAHLERWRDLAELFRAALERDSENRAYALRLADLLEVILESPEEALDVLRGMLERNPEDPEALRAFEGVFSRAGLDHTDRADELIPVLEALGAQASDNWQRRGFEFRIGEILEHSLKRHEDSVERYGRVLREDVDHLRALEALERLSRLPTCRQEACVILDEHYRGRKAYGPLAEVLERKLEDVTDATERASVLAEVGQIQEQHLENPEASFRAYARAFREEPSDPLLLEAVERLGTSLTYHEELAGLLEDGATALATAGGRGTVEHRVNLLTFLATLYASTLHDVGLAISAYERALALRPERKDVFEALEQLYTKEGRYRDLATLYRGRLEREPGDRAIVLKLARVLDELLEEPQEALIVLRAFLAVTPGDVEAMRAFDGIFTGARLDQGEAARELLPILVALRDASEGAEAREYEYRSGRLQELSLSQPSEAVPHYAAVLTADAAHGGSREALERLLEREGTRKAVAEVLEPYYRAEQEWRPLVHLLELRAGDAPKANQKARLLSEVGRLQEEQLGDKELAFSAYARAFAARPHDEKLLEAVARLAADLDAFAKLADLLAGAADALEAADGEAHVPYRVGVLQRLARTASAILAENERAIEAYHRALALDPDNDTTLTGLDRLFTAEGRPRELAGILEREIARASEVPESYDRIDLLRRLARLREEVFGDLDGAASSFEELRGASPDDAEAAGALERLYEASGRWRDLAHLILETTRDDVGGRTRLLRAADLLEHKVGDLGRARGIYDRLLKANSDDAEALHGLERVLSQKEMKGREEDLLEVLRALEVRSADPRERAALLYRQGALLAGPLKQPSRAIDALTQVLELDAEHREALVALEQLVQVEEVRELALDRLETFYERGGLWQALVDLYETLLPGRAADDRRALLRKMAEIYERELRNPRLAFRDYARLFREKPENRALLDVLERLAQEMNNFEGLGNLYDEFIADIPEPELGLELNLRLAQLFEETLGRKSLAVDRYRSALDIDSRCVPALDALDRIHSATEEWIDLEKILKIKLQLAESEEVQADLHCRLGTIYEGHLGLAGAAVDSFESALQVSAGNEVALAALERIFSQRDDVVLRRHIAETLRPLYAERDDQRRLATLDLGLAEVSAAEDREPLLLAAARVHEDLEEPQRAFRILLEGLRDGIHGEAILATLDRLAGAVSGWDELCAAADAAAAALPEDDAVREALTLRAAKWYWDRLSDPSAAEERYAWVFLRDPTASPAFHALEAIHTAVFDADKLLDLFRRRLAVVRDRDERAHLLKRVGDINADFLQRIDEAIQAYEESARLKPEDVAVLDALAPLYEQQTRYQDLCKVLERKLAFADEHEKFLIRRRLAEIWGAEIGDDGQAIAQYRAALTLMPTDLELWRALRWHCERAERWPELTDALRRELELTPDPAERAQVARHLAQVEEERLQRPEKAADALRMLLESDPNDSGALRQYEGLLRRTERWDALVELYEQRLAAGPAVDERAHFLAQLADVAERHLTDLPRATEALEQLCELLPQDVNVLRNLARLYENQGRWKESFEFFKAQVKRVGETGEVAVELLVRMGQLCEERAKNLEVAEKCYQRAIDLDGASRTALQGLRRVYGQREDQQAVVQTIEAEEALVEGESKAALAMERAKILRDELNDREGAAAAFDAALQSAPTNVEAANNLVELLTAGAGREMMRRSLPALIGLFGKTRRIPNRHMILHRLGELCESIGEVEGSIAAYEGAYHASSSHLPTLLSLGRLYYDAGHWDKAVKMLQILLLNEESLPNASDRVQMFYRLGAIRQKMGEKGRATNMYERALAIDPQHVESRRALDELSRKG